MGMTVVFSPRRVAAMVAVSLLCLAFVAVPWVPFGAAVWLAALLVVMMFPKPNKVMPDEEKGYKAAQACQLIRRKLTGFSKLMWRLSPLTKRNTTQAAPDEEEKSSISQLFVAMLARLVAWLRDLLSPVSFASLGAACVGMFMVAADLMVSHVLSVHASDLPTRTITDGIDFDPASRLWWFTAPLSFPFGWIIAHSYTSLGRMKVAAKIFNEGGMLMLTPVECPAASVQGTLKETLTDIIRSVGIPKLIILGAPVVLAAASDILSGLLFDVSRPISSNVGIAGPLLGYVSLLSLITGRKVLLEEVISQRAKWEEDTTEERQWPIRWASISGTIEDAPEYQSHLTQLKPSKNPTHKVMYFQLMGGKDFSDYAKAASKLAPVFEHNKMLLIEELMVRPETGKAGSSKSFFKVTHELGNLTKSNLNDYKLDHETRNFILTWMVLSALDDIKLPRLAFRDAALLTKLENEDESQNRKWIYRTRWSITNTVVYSDYAKKAPQLREKLGCDWVRVSQKPSDNYLSIMFGSSPYECKIKPVHRLLVTRADWNYFMRSSGIVGSADQTPELIKCDIDEQAQQYDLVFSVPAGLNKDEIKSKFSKLSTVSGLECIRSGRHMSPSKINLLAYLKDPLENHYNYADYVDKILKSPVKGEPQLDWHIGVGHSGDLIKFEWDSESPHLLIAGNTGSGKSGIVNSMLTQMFHNNHPEDVEFWLADPKNELQVYQNLAHVRYFLDQHCTKEHHLVAAQHLLEAAQQEMEHRYATFLEHPDKPQDLGRARSIAKKNPEQHGNLMFPYLYILIEECASYLSKHASVDNEDKKVWTRIMKAINDIAMKGRAAGITIITCTQYPTKENISQVLKQQSRRIGLRTTDNVGSKVILDSVGLEKIRTPGRGMLTSSKVKGFIHFKGLWLRNVHENIGASLDERMALVANICFTRKWPKLPEGLEPGLVTECDDTEVLWPEKKPVWDHDFRTNNIRGGRSGKRRNQVDGFSAEDWLGALQSISRSDDLEDNNFSFFAEDDDDYAPRSHPARHHRRRLPSDVEDLMRHRAREIDAGRNTQVEPPTEHVPSSRSGNGTSYSENNSDLWDVDDEESIIDPSEADDWDNNGAPYDPAADWAENSDLPPDMDSWWDNGDTYPEADDWWDNNAPDEVPEEETLAPPPPEPEDTPPERPTKTVIPDNDKLSDVLAKAKKRQQPIPHQDNSSSYSDQVNVLRRFQKTRIST